MNSKNIFIKILLSTLNLSLLWICSCSSSWLGINKGSDRDKPIANPFGDFRPGAHGDPQNMVLRTKKGDRSVEIEIPGYNDQLNGFLLPASSSLKELRSSGENVNDVGTLDESYKTRTPSMSDREITSSFSHGSEEDEAKMRDIEQSLNLTPSEDQGPREGEPSYLAQLDHIKQLYKLSRYEAALIETDEMIKKYQTDAKLHEMRGTLLDRLGRRELALKSWNQALRFNPKNQNLRRFIEHKQLTATMGTSP